MPFLFEVQLISFLGQRDRFPVPGIWRSRHARPCGVGPTIAAAALTAAGCVTTSTPEPRTLAGAEAAAKKYFTFYAALRFAATYPMLSPADRLRIRELVWAEVNQTCDTNGRVSYNVHKVVKRSSPGGIGG